jgi:hypothetical protein
MCLRIAEIDQHSVAHVFRDKTVEPGNRLCDAAVIRADQLAQILGVKPRRQRRRADQIAEHHAQLAALDLHPHPSLPRKRRKRGRDREGAERGNGVEQSAAMANRGDPKLAKVLGRQPAQYFPVNVVVAERGLILLEPEAAQPFAYIHSRSPKNGWPRIPLQSGSPFCPGGRSGGSKLEDACMGAHITRPT